MGGPGDGDGAGIGGCRIAGTRHLRQDTRGAGCIDGDRALIGRGRVADVGAGSNPELPPLTLTVPELVVVTLPLCAGASMPSIPLTLPELMQVRSPLL
jgi:hypothetical protein